MALTPSSSRPTVPNKYKETDTSPGRTKIWTQPPNSNPKPHAATVRKFIAVPVIYYLSRNGHLEHPHFMEVPLSSSQGLFLRDVINRLNFLRGKGMANHYSWSAKRSYKNGYVWHDLEENDLILPVHSHEYILKGSEILLESSSPPPNPISDSSETPPEETVAKSDNEFPLRTRRRNQSWSAINLHEYKVYKTTFSGELSGKSAATDASTQTDEKRHRKRQPPNTCEIVVEEQEEKLQEEVEVSPPPSDSSPETLASLMKAVANLAPPSDSVSAVGRRTDRNVKTSSILASLISCGSFRDCGAKESGFSLISHYRGRLPRGGNRAVEEAESVSSGLTSGSFVKMEKEYFSGSLVETRKDDFASLKRSSSYNADRRSQLRLGEKEMDGVRAKCIPRKQKAACPQPPKKEWSDEMAIKGSNVS